MLMRRKRRKFRTEIYERHLSQDCMHVMTASDQNRISETANRL